jgi:hypothetical protein
MIEPVDPRKRAGELRDLAERARRLAAGLSRSDDRDRLLGYGDELEQQAAAIERQAGGKAPRTSVSQQQQQVQQSQQQDPPSDPDKPKDD